MQTLYNLEPMSGYEEAKGLVPDHFAVLGTAMGLYSDPDNRIERPKLLGLELHRRNSHHILATWNSGVPGQRGNFLRLSGDLQ